MPLTVPPAAPGAPVDLADASRYASGGTGAVGAPFVSPSGTGCVQEAAAATGAAGRSLRVRLPDAEFSVTTPYAFSGDRSLIEGTGAAWGSDPNAEARPATGAVLALSGTALAALTLSGGSGVTVRGFGIWGRGRHYAAADDDAASGYNAGIDVDGRHDKLVVDRVFAGRCHVGMDVRGSTQLDVWTVVDSGFIGNWYGVRLRGDGGSIMSNWTRLTIADNDGPGFWSDVGMYRNKISGCNFVRNCRGMTGGGAQVQVYGPGTIVTANDFSEAGRMQSESAGIDESGLGTDDTGGPLAFDFQQPNIDDIRVRGQQVQIFGNQFTNHGSSGGACIHVMSDAIGTYIGPNQWFGSDATQIKIEAGAQDTTIVVCPGLNMVQIDDAGSNTRYIPFTGGLRADWGPSRLVLQGDRTYYVRPGGADFNDGLTNDDFHALQTVQAALDLATRLDLNGHTLTIDVQTGTFVGAITIPAMTGQATAGNLFITSSSGGAILQTDVGFGDIILAGAGARVRVGAVELSGAVANVLALHALTGATIEVAGTTFGANLFAGCAAEGGTIQMVSDYTISGGGYTHLLIEAGGYYRAVFSGTITLTGTPAFTQFAQCASAAVTRIQGVTFSGSATGSRFNAELNGVITTAGAGVGYLPGDGAGTTATGGQYG
jgi:hypothetical protein